VIRSSLSAFADRISIPARQRSGPMTFNFGLITSLIGGRPGMISGATGALAVVMVALVAQHGVEYLFATVVIMGILQILSGVFRLGKFIRLVPHPVMLGFVKGLVMLTMIIIWLTPKITKFIPAPLAGIGIVTALVIGLGLDVRRVGDLASIEGGLPSFHIPAVPLTVETFSIILPYAVILAAIGLIESLLTLNLIGDIKEERGGASQECVAQGIANTVTGFFGGMGGCAMIGQSMINVKSGGRTRLSGLSAALFLLSFILLAFPVIEQIPLAALVGVMFMVVIGTFAWQSLTIMTRIPKLDAFVIILVTAVTVWHDLAVAVVVGVIVSALAYAWNNARRIAAHSRLEDDTKVYHINGPLFFGSIEGFSEVFTVSEDPDTVIIDFAHSRVVDQSALQAIENIAAKYTQAGKVIRLRHLTKDCHTLLNRAGQLMIDSDDDPEYALAVDYSVRLGRFGSGH